MPNIPKYKNKNWRNLDIDAAKNEIIKGAPDPKIVRDLEIVKEILSNGWRATSMKYGLSKQDLLLLRAKVVGRVKNSFIRTPHPNGHVSFKGLGLKVCSIKGCNNFGVGNDDCPKHARTIKAIKKRAAKIVRPGELRMADAIYGAIMETIIKMCTKNSEIVDRYFSKMNNDIVDMAVKGNFLSTRPVKAILVENGIRLIGILKGLQSRHEERFNENVRDWTEQYMEFAKNGASAVTRKGKRFIE